jgi:hypothetical protein
MSSDRPSRRHFFYGSLLTGAIPLGGFGSVASLKAMGYKSPNEKLNLAAIGAGGQPAADLRGAQAGVENVVALADVDWARGKESFERYPDAKRYKDFRQMLDKSGKDIDAVVIGTPDHMHTYCAVHCMAAGKHVYVEKPLTRVAGETRIMAAAAEKYKVATQMGNQGYSHDATRSDRGACVDGAAIVAAGDAENAAADGGSGHARLGLVVGDGGGAAVYGGR